MTEPYTLQELAAEYTHIGCPPPDIAAPRLGMTRAALEKRLHQARRAGLVPPVDNHGRIVHGRTA